MKLSFNIAKKKSHPVIILCAIAALLSGIAGCCLCSPIVLQGTMLFTNFTKAEMNEVIIKRYTAGSNFNAFIDSTIESTAPVVSGGDTSYLALGNYLNSSNSAASDTAALYDLLVYIPADSLSFKVTHIVITDVIECSQCKSNPAPALKSYYLNSVPVTASNLSGGSTMAINK